MDIKVTHQEGGMMESEKTGLYPDYLIFSSSSLKRSWRFKRKKDIQKGLLRINGEIKYEFTYYGAECKIQQVEKDGSTSNCITVEVVTMMCD